jgi:hypothetical protein
MWTRCVPYACVSVHSGKRSGGQLLRKSDRPDIYLRMPRNSQMINLSMRVRLTDLATVCILSCVADATLRDIQSRCVQEKAQLEIYPLHIFNIVLERRKEEFGHWVERLWKHVSDLEDVTGMTAWHTPRLSILADKPKDDYTGLLQQLHAQNVELRLAQTIFSFAAGLGLQFKKVLAAIEDLREEMGGKALKRGERAGLEAQIEFNDEVLGTMRKKIVELLFRVESQINVVCAINRSWMITFLTFDAETDLTWVIDI